MTFSASQRCSTAALLLLAMTAAACGARRPTLQDAFAAHGQGDRARAIELYGAIAQENPESVEGAMAADAFIELTGQRLFPEPGYECSAQAAAAYAEAERLFTGHQPRAAIDAYDQALSLCPGNALWWIHAGDAYFNMNDYEAARRFYLRGLEIDPWSRSGHRFLADADLRLGDASAAYESATLAVLSDPTYAMGWESLRAVTEALGGEWNRRDYEYKAWVDEQDGKPTIHLSANQGSAASTTAWLLYGLGRYAATLEDKETGESEKSSESRLFPPRAEWVAMTPLERERLLLEIALKRYSGYVAENPGTETRYWETMRRAGALGFTDEAIYMNLMDADLAPSYPEFRESHKDRLVEYVQTVIAPLPREGGREVRGKTPNDLGLAAAGGRQAWWPEP